MHRLFVLMLLVVMGSAIAKTHESSPSERFETALDLIHAYSGSGDELQRAMQLAEELSKSHPDSGYFQTLLSEALSTWELEQNGEPAALRIQLIQLSDEALRLNPNLAEAHVAKARALVRASMYDEANSAIDAGLGLKPNLSGALFLRAEVFRRTANLADADAWYRKFIDSTPSRTRKSNGFGWLAKMYEDAAWSSPAEKKGFLLVQARAAYEQMLELDPNGAWKVVNFAIFLNDDVADFEAAERHAQRALGIMEFPMARYHLAAARYQKLLASMGSMDDPALRNAVERISSSTSVSLDDAIAFSSFSTLIRSRLQLLQTRISTPAD